MADKKKSKEQLIAEIRLLRKKVSRYEKIGCRGKKEVRTPKESGKKLLHSLCERIKELSCLYGLSKLAEKPHSSLEMIFQGMTDLFPTSWQYPEITCARIVFQDKEFKTNNFKESTWRQTAEIAAFGKKTGFAEVLYLVRRPDCCEGPFLKEERLLINAVAQQLGRIIERKTMEDELKKSEAKLRDQKLSLEQKNVALREIVAQIEMERTKIGNDIMSNLKNSVFPIVEKIKKDKKNIRPYVDLLRHRLNELTSSFGSKITNNPINLTPKEIEICNMIRGNLTSKEISGLLSISRQTVEKHRKRIRKKMEISNKKINLVSFLQQL